MADPVDPPSLEMKIDELVDWLELSALFSEFGLVRLDALDGALNELSEEAEDDIGARDRETERRREAIENEIDLRHKNLADTYPFALSAAGDELSILPTWRDEIRLSFYIVCLITSHVTGSSILNKPPVGALLVRLRNRIFQIVSTLAMAGLSGGPAISVGWPRITGEAITQLLQRAQGLGAGLTVRVPPGQYVPPEEKDGGIDVIAWSGEPMPPPTHFYFAQVASGNNWENKPVSEKAAVFRNNYILDLMSGNLDHVTLIPFRVADNINWNSQHLAHRAILHRLRLPFQAQAGLLRSQQGIPVDEADQVVHVTTWVSDYHNFALA